MSFQMMEDNLKSYGLVPEEFPIVLQYNKRDVEDAVPLGAVERELGLGGIRVMEAIAIEGVGVMETIKEITKMVIQRFEL